MLGTLDVGLISDMGIDSAIGHLGWAWLPFMLTSYDMVDQYYVNGWIGEELTKQMKAKGIIRLAATENGFRQCANVKRPIRSIDDIKGMKIRVPQTKACRDFYNAIGAIPALIMPIIIFGGIYGGVFTATEAGAAAVAYGALFFFIKKFIIRDKDVDETFYGMLVHSSVATATICILIGFSNCSGRIISMIGIAQAIKEFVTAHVSNVNVFLICGMLIDINAAILLIVPLLLPTAQAMGVDTIHFGAIILVNLSVGFITPPFCSSVFMAQKLSGARYVEIVRDVIPFVIASLIVVVLTTYVPFISTFIPRLAAGTL